MAITFDAVKNWALTTSTGTVAQNPGTIEVVDATQLPATVPYRVVVWRSTKGSPYQDAHRKVFEVTGVAGNVLTVTAISGDATALGLGSAVAVHVLAEDLTDLQEVVADVETRLIPAGGTTGQVLAKSSNSDYAVTWADDEAGGDVFGPAGAVLGNFPSFADTSGKLLADSGYAATDFAVDDHVHTGVYEPANVNIQGHIAATGNPHGATPADIGAAPAANGVTGGDAHDHSGGDGAQIAYSTLSGTPDLSSLHTRGHAVASALDHTDWPAGLTVGELGYVHGVTSAIQTQLDGKSASAHDHAGVYEPTITAGTSDQYLRGDKTWQTLNQAAVAGLTTTDIVQHGGLGVGTVPTAGVQVHVRDKVNNLNVWQIGPNAADMYCQFMFGESSADGGYGGIYRPSNASAGGGTTVFYSRGKPLALSTHSTFTYPGYWHFVMDTSGNVEIRKGLKVGTDATNTLGFYGATPVTQRANAAQAAAPAGGTGTAAGAYDTAANRDALIALVNEMRTVLVNLGLMKGSA